MKYVIDFKIPQSDWKIEPNFKFLSFGSCFSDEVGSLLKQDGFSVVSNPFGVLFHPIPLAKNIQKIIRKDCATQIVQHHDLYFSWNASGTFFSYAQSELENRFATAIETLHEQLKNATVLLITFGTSFGYRHIETNEIVVNCHKQPQMLFQKELSELSEMRAIWTETLAALKTFNSHLKVIFTVSPVKHLRDGVVENVRSKARLIELVHKLGENYFPSFELIQEQLRDYRFYKVDGAHPNEIAIQEVYKRFIETYFSDNAKEFQQEITKFNTLKNHHSLYAESTQTKALNERIELEFKRLKGKYWFWEIIKST